MLRKDPKPAAVSHKVTSQDSEHIHVIIQHRDSGMRWTEALALVVEYDLYVCYCKGYWSRG